MPKAARISISVPVKSAPQRAETGASQFVTVALFSCVGLLITLVAVIFGIHLALS